jgi:molybdenum cofactor cytidylyltransferase
VRSVAAVVLAAGASTRLGEPKQLVLLGGETLLERSVRIAREAGCSPVVVVLGANHAHVLDRCLLRDAEFVINKDWEEGMGSSIRLGVQTLKKVAEDVEGVVLMTCDQPAVTAQHLHFITAKDEIKASRYAGRNGIPAYFPAEYFGKLMTLHGDVGARNLLLDAGFEELTDGELDVDTHEDLQRARILFGEFDC